jgi:xanthine/CO dehydrogenase XdhC/CoxF family maturation factor
LSDPSDEVVVDWPHRHLIAEAEADRIDDRTVICVLTHDVKFGVPLLEVALSLPVAYIGAMGSAALTRTAYGGSRAGSTTVKSPRSPSGRS